MIARGRLRTLRRAVDCLRLSSRQLDMRQNSAVHERTVAELLEAAAPARITSICRRLARTALLIGELRNSRPLASLHLELRRRDVSELPCWRCRQMRTRFGTRVMPQCVISMAEWRLRYP